MLHVVLKNGVCYHKAWYRGMNNQEKELWHFFLRQNKWQSAREICCIQGKKKRKKKRRVNTPVGFEVDWLW